MWSFHRSCMAVILLSGGCGTQPSVPTTTGSTKQPQPPSPPPTDATAERVKTLLARIDDDPDPLHIDFTPTVHELINVGVPAILPTLDLMLSDDNLTRMRAQRVIEGVMGVEYGFVSGQGWKKVGGEEQWRKQWAELGDLDYQASSEKRLASVTLWKSWLASRAKK